MARPAAKPRKLRDQATLEATLQVPRKHLVGNSTLEEAEPGLRVIEGVLHELAHGVVLGLDTVAMSDKVIGKTLMEQSNTQPLRCDWNEVRALAIEATVLDWFGCLGKVDLPQLCETAAATMNTKRFQNGATVLAQVQALRPTKRTAVLAQRVVDFVRDELPALEVRR